MSRTRSVCLALILWALIYFVGLYVIPRLAPLRQLRELHPWIGPGDITQVVFLLLSLAAMLIIGRGDLARFGFRGIQPRQLAKPILVTVVAQVMVLFVGMAAMAIVMGPEADGPPGGDGTNPFGSLLKAVISVWIIASCIEEVFYRGLLQSLLEPLRTDGFKLFKVRISLPVLICGLLFGLGHLCLIGAIGGVPLVHIIVATTILGLIAGYYREKTGSLLPAMVAHSIANVVGMTIPLVLMSVMRG